MKRWRGDLPVSLSCWPRPYQHCRRIISAGTAPGRRRAWAMPGAGLAPMAGRRQTGGAHTSAGGTEALSFNSQPPAAAGLTTPKSGCKGIAMTDRQPDNAPGIVSGRKRRTLIPLEANNRQGSLSRAARNIC